MDSEKIKKIVNLSILKFIDYLNKNNYKLSQYCTLIGVSDDSIRKWLKGENIGKNSIKKISECYIKNSMNETNILDQFKKYLLSQTNLDLNNVHKSRIETFNKIEDILIYLKSDIFYTDFQRDSILNITFDNIKYYKEALYKKISIDMLKNKFYEPSQSSDFQNDSIILNFCFYGMTYRVHIFLSDELLCTKNQKFKSLKNQLKNFQDINSSSYLFIKSLNEKDRTDAYVIFTFDNYPQENLLMLSTLLSPIYIKKISQESLNKQVISLTYTLPNMDIFDLINYNKFADYVLNSLQYDFGLFFKNSLAKYDILKKQGFDKNTFQSYNQEIEFEVSLLIPELIDIINKQSIIKILAMNYQSYEILISALNALYDTIKSNIAIQVFITDNSSSLINKIKINNPNPNISYSFYCMKSNFLDYITSEKELYNQVDLVIIGMGSLSFFRNPQRYFMYINSWLKKNAKIFISTYSSCSQDLSDYKNILRKNLPFISGISKEIGECAFQPQSHIRLYCKTYEKNELQQEVKKYFTIDKEKHSDSLKVYMHPTFSYLISETIPNSYLDNLYKLEKEYSTSKNNRSSLGYFIVLIAKKQIELNQESNYLSRKKLIKHNIALNRSWHLNKLKEVDNEFANAILLKTILLKSKHSNQIYCVIISSDRVLTEEINTNSSSITGCKKFIEDKLQLLTSKEINGLGFEIGNMNPFEKYSNTCKYYYDKNIFKNGAKNFIFGSGSPDSSYFVTLKQLKQLFIENNYIEADIITNYFDLMNH